MSILGNVLWLILGGGVIICAEYLAGGMVLCLTVAGIPFGIQCFKLAILGLAPFGRTIEQTTAASGCLTVAMNIIWLLCGGIWIAATHLVLTFLCAVSVIGLPFARQHAKMAAMALTPFGRTIA